MTSNLILENILKLVFRNVWIKPFFTPKCGEITTSKVSSHFKIIHLVYEIIRHSKNMLIQTTLDVDDYKVSTVLLWRIS